MIHLVTMNGVPIAASAKAINAAKFVAHQLDQSGQHGGDYTIRKIDGELSDVVVPIITDEEVANYAGSD